MPGNPNSAALAAFDICESLLLTLEGLNVLSQAQVIDILKDASEAHRNILPHDRDLLLHRQTADRIERLIQSRLPKR